MGFIVLASTLSALHIIPIEGLALLLGVDRFMSEGRSIVNLIGNGVATIVVAKSEKEFDESKHAESNYGNETNETSNHKHIRYGINSPRYNKS